MHVPRTVLYALQASVVLTKSKRGEPVPCKVLCQHGKMPKRFLVQVLRRLVNHGVLESTKGPSGGYVLARPPAEISLMQIVDAFNNPLEPKLPSVPGIAPLLWERVQMSVAKSAEAGRVHLERVTLADLARATPAESLLPSPEAIITPIQSPRRRRNALASG
jgi:Rrf2 family protein